MFFVVKSFYKNNIHTNRLVLLKIVWRSSSFKGFVYRTCKISKRTSIIKKIFLDVPQVSTPEPLIGSEIGRSVQLKCKTSAYPEALIYWRHGGKNFNIGNNMFTFYGEIIWLELPLQSWYFFTYCLGKILLNGTRNYIITETRQSNIDVTSILTIKRVRKKEMAKYECNVNNSLGESMVSLQLYRKL